MTLHAKPPNATHLSVRSMAAVAGNSYSSVHRIWHAHGLKPHLVETFKISRAAYLANLLAIDGFIRFFDDPHLFAPSGFAETN